MTLHFNGNTSGPKKSFQLSGQIDEDADFSKYSLAGSQEVIVDFSAVSLINSCGIREWIKWMDSAKGAKIIYKNCPKVIVDQINMVDGFLPKGAMVESFFVPYFCEECDSITNVLLTAGKDYSKGSVKVAGENPCPNCKNKAEIDVIEGKYFKFVQKAA